jgi:uncharacterized protein YaaN involved in tellurite resistance
MEDEELTMPSERQPEIISATDEIVLAVSGAVDVPATPEAMTDEEQVAARRQAQELVRGVRETSGSRQLAVLDDLSSVGLQSQRNAGRQLELVKTRLATLLDEGGAGKDVASDLVGLRSALDQINPALEQRSFWGRTVGALPGMRKNVLVRALKKIAIRYEPISKQVTIIETKLREGRTLLARDNIELRRLYEDIESQQDAIARQAYLGELLLLELTPLVDEATDPMQRDRLQGAVHDVATRVQDLYTMREVHIQYFVSIELTRQNNVRLGQAVDRTLTLATNVVTVGLALQAALVRQQRVKEAAERTQAFLGEMITQNAAAIRRQTEEIGDLYNDPVIALDKLTQAHRDLLSALDTASRLREEGLEAARQNIAEITVLTREIAEHVQGLEDEDARRR